MRSAKLPAVAACLILQVASSSALGGEVLDLRKCPLDTLTFVDPWAGGSFAVKRVGADHYYVCDSGTSKEPIAGEQCPGPYGSLVLVGDYIKYRGDAPVPVLAEWYSYYQTSPCCGWNIQLPDSADGKKLLAEVRWPEPAQVPLLGDQSFAGIDPDIEPENWSPGFGNPLYAISCTLR